MLSLSGIASLTQFLLGRDELPFLAHWGGWLSLIAFGILTYGLVQVPFGKRKRPA